MLNKILSHFKTSESFLEMLPPEIHHKIGSYLEPKDLLNLILVSRTFFRIYLDEHFLKTEQKFLYHIRRYKENADMLKTEAALIQKQIIQRDQSRFKSFQERIENALKSLPHDSGAHNIYNDCFKLAEDIKSKIEPSGLYYHPSRHREIFITANIFLLTIFFLIFSFKRIYPFLSRGDQNDRIRRNHAFFSLEAINHNCCLRKGLKKMSEECQKIYMNYYNQTILPPISLNMAEELGMVFYHVLFIISVIATIMLLCLMLSPNEEKISTKETIYTSELTYKLQSDHFRKLQKIARTFPDLLKASTINDLVRQLMRIYETQPSIPKNLSLYLEGKKLLQELQEMKTYKSTAFNYADNRRLTLFGNDCDQLEKACVEYVRSSLVC